MSIGVSWFQNGARVSSGKANSIPVDGGSPVRCISPRVRRSIVSATSIPSRPVRPDAVSYDTSV